ncbi:MAG: hypothetical protein KBS65_06175 [Prevotella sp.]|nr:hypothetical protein [Candidatus Equicola stercoris]
MGFEGFVTIQDLMTSMLCVPKKKGVYAIIRLSNDKPHFLKVGTGGHFKGKDPNVPITELENNWVCDTDIVYIGKAGSIKGSATLHSRLNQYMKFGQGKNIGHKGGRYIWQLADSKLLLVCWLTTPDEDPEDVEKNLIQDFKLAHCGNRPFANLRD